MPNMETVLESISQKFCDPARQTIDLKYAYNRINLTHETAKHCNRKTGT